MSNLPILSMIE